MLDLPYLKFHVNEWLTGDISVEDYEVQGVFSIIFSLYWSKQGKLTKGFIKKKFRDVPEIITRLFDAEILKDDGEFIVIDFLDEQMAERKKISKRNAKNGKLGGRPAKTEKHEALEPLVSLDIKPTALDSQSEEQPKQSNKEEKRKEKKKKEEKNILKKDGVPPQKKSFFLRPTIEEIAAFCLERSNGIDAEQFFNFYEAADWKRGNTKIKNWKACIVTWEKNNTKQNAATGGLKLTAYTYEQIVPKVTSKELSLDQWRPVQVGTNAQAVYVHVDEIKKHNLQPFNFKK